MSTLHCWETASGVTDPGISVDKPDALSASGPDAKDAEVGDVLLILVATDSGTTPEFDNSTNRPTGFELINYAAPSSLDDVHVAAFRRVVDGTEGSSFSVPTASAGFTTDIRAYCVLVSGVDNTTPIMVVGADSTVPPASTPLDLASITTTADSALCFYVIAGDGADTSPFGQPTNWTEREDVGTGTASGGVGMAWGTRELATAGATGDATVSANSSDQLAGFLFALTPSSGDTTAPTLSSPSASATGSTTGSGSVSTDEDNGTLYWVVTTSATSPSVAQIQAGNDHTGSAAVDSGSQAVSATGTQNVSGGFTGLTEGTTYYAHYQQQDAATNDSTVSTSSAFTTDYVLTAEAGTFTITGADATPLVDYYISAESGTVAITGSDVDFERTVVGNPGAFVITGFDADLTVQRVLSAEAGSVSITGSDAGLSRTFSLLADTGVFTVSGLDADLRFGNELFAGAGAFTITGFDATLSVQRYLSAEAGVFVITGLDAGLVSSTSLAPPPRNSRGSSHWHNSREASY